MNDGPALTAGLVDAHCHVDLYPSPLDVVICANRLEIHTIAVTNAPFVFQHTEALARGSRFVHPAIGMHPELVATQGHDLERLLALLPNTKFVGEVGLDYTSGDPNSRARQREVFSKIVERCSAENVLSVHSRKAAADAISIIGSKFPGKVILHWMTGSPPELKLAIERGFYFSVNPKMVQRGRESKLLLSMPRNRVLTETDGPFVRNGDGTPAAPADVVSVVDALARLWNQTFSEAKRTVLFNWRRVVGDG